MSLGSNLQYLRRLCKNMTQEALAEKLNVSRQTISKWEMDSAQPEIDKAIELCKIFHCSLDNLFREEMNKKSDAYTDLRVEEVEGFRYITHTVVSSDPEGDALDRVIKIAKENGVEHPRVVGWDFPNVSVEQANVYNMHGYTAAWILPEGLTPEGVEIKEQAGHKYAAIHIGKPFENPFVIIPGAYRTLNDYMRVNGLNFSAEGVIPCFETAGESMDVYIACE
ncbi:MAG: helix-turn-helix domain-containing protein [Acetatifactor sp.]